jgi:hypothetical protein
LPSSRSRKRCGDGITEQNFRARSTFTPAHTTNGGVKVLSLSPELLHCGGERPRLRTIAGAMRPPTPNSIEAIPNIDRKLHATQSGGGGGVGFLTIRMMTIPQPMIQISVITWAKRMTPPCLS